MVKLNKKVEYALIALKHIIASEEGLITAKDIADRYDCPFDATARALQIMVKQGMLKSERGINGGYVMCGDLRNITFFQLIEMLTGPVGVAECVTPALEKKECKVKDQCNIISSVAFLQNQYFRLLKGISVQDVLFPSDTGGPL